MSLSAPPNMPRIAKVIKHWPYRHFFDFDKRKAAGIEGRLIEMYRMEFRENPALETLRLEMAAVTCPERPHNHIDNHSGFEVELKNGTRAFLLYSDFHVTMFQLP